MVTQIVFGEMDRLVKYSFLHPLAEFDTKTRLFGASCFFSGPPAVHAPVIVNAAAAAAPVVVTINDKSILGFVKRHFRCASTIAGLVSMSPLSLAERRGGGGDCPPARLLPPSDRHLTATNERLLDQDVRLKLDWLSE